MKDKLSTYTFFTPTLYSKYRRIHPVKTVMYQLICYCCWVDIRTYHFNQHFINHYSTQNVSIVSLVDLLIVMPLFSFLQCYVYYTPSQRGNYHHGMFHNPTAAVNLFHVGKQYRTFCKAKAAVTHNLIGRKIISNVKHPDARKSLPILDVVRSSHKRRSAAEYCK